MKKEVTIREVLNKVVFCFLLTAAFNLSFHVSENKPLDKLGNSSAYIDEQEFTFLPFRQQEATAPNIQIVTTGFISLPEWQVVDHWISVDKPFERLELFYRQNANSFKEYPFIVLVRKLRI